MPVTPTFTSNPSSSSPDVLSESPEELDGDPLFGIPAVGIELGLPEDDAVDPELDELLELELELEELDRDELDAEGIDGDPDLEELEADGMDGEDDGELELEELDDDELLELELLLDDAVGIEDDGLELLWLVSVLQPASMMLRAEAAMRAFTGNATAEVFMVVFSASCLADHQFAGQGLTLYLITTISYQDRYIMPCFQKALTNTFEAEEMTLRNFIPAFSLYSILYCIF